MSRVVVTRGSGAVPLAPTLAALPVQVEISPWMDATQDEAGQWQLPEYPCELQGLAPDDPRNVKWRPGDFALGVDNVAPVWDGEKMEFVEYGGQKMWKGDLPPREWNPKRLPGNVQELLKVPHMPGQPVKEMFARMKALEPRMFEDRYFQDIRRDLPKDWEHQVKRLRWAEKRGIFTEASPGEWAGQEKLVVPAVYTTARPDTATICVGYAGVSESSLPPVRPAPGTEYDFLELLYVKDQEGKVVQVVPFESGGMTPSLFWTYSFQPPKGTTQLTPFASFAIRGVWQGDSIHWDPAEGSQDMDWFTNMPLAQRRQLADPDRLAGYQDTEAGLPRARREKELPKLWPENSWQGNVAKAHFWNDMQK
mmetsp:Transcript_32323/g.72599  ORF Transcript_32323/g.72599 Transcript_32323/m.72599 type:complete len:365 (+) Transcript_32323:56-1150(+)